VLEVGSGDRFTWAEKDFILGCHANMPSDMGSRLPCRNARHRRYSPRRRPALRQSGYQRQASGGAGASCTVHLIRGANRANFDYVKLREKDTRLAPATEIYTLAPDTVPFIERPDHIYSARITRVVRDEPRRQSDCVRKFSQRIYLS